MGSDTREKSDQRKIVALIQANHVIRTTVPRFTPPPSSRVFKAAESVDRATNSSVAAKDTAPQKALAGLPLSKDDNDDEIEFLFEKEGVPGTEARKWLPEMKKKKKRRKKKVENPPMTLQLTLTAGANINEEQQEKPIITQDVSSLNPRVSM